MLACKKISFDGRYFMISSYEWDNHGMLLVRWIEPTRSQELSYLLDDTPSLYAPPRTTII